MRDTVHKAGGWAGVLLAIASLLNSYFEAQTARSNTIQAASMAQIEAVDEVEDDIEELRDRVRVLEKRIISRRRRSGSIPAARSIRIMPEPKKRVKKKQAEVQQRYEDLLLK